MDWIWFGIGCLLLVFCGACLIKSKNEATGGKVNRWDLFGLMLAFAALGAIIVWAFGVVKS